MENKINKVIAVSSGKGGVGKSFVSALTAVTLSRQGYKVGILDADITGPSIPKMFGVTDPLYANEDMQLVPSETEKGIKIVSVNLMLEDETTPVLWRGPVLAKMIGQFWNQTAWGELDYLIIDMPPGTGDIPLTVYQTIPVSGVVIVSSPQDLVRLIVAKSVNMAKHMDIPVIGIVENYSYMECPDCGKKLYPFGMSDIEAVAESVGTVVIGKLPIVPDFAALADLGMFEKVKLEGLDYNITEYIR